ncbi:MULTISPECIES: TetR/AcrR family transcriptional regulator [Paenibacillus]|uniref:TetR/AcrR family transcriptional regulator n=1 Tax=Paenibacillus TaxID=44249 RepID=UPI0008381595|nr:MULTISPECIES: TetR/AcrR family transcriptional regulator [Paenibacillus]GIP23524.1 hypothetical protein J22TS3_37990 [Paenibacillus sp. J22TS3]
MDTKSWSSSDRLLLAAIDLFAEKGYNGVTTKEIAAAANLSEMTLFRQFGSKQNLLEAAVDRFHYGPEMKTLFQEKLVWDLQTDLLLVSRTYHEIMNRNTKLIQIGVKESARIPGLHERLHQHPRQLKEFLTRYFEGMYERGKLIQTSPEHLALAFMWMNHGAFLDSRRPERSLSTAPLDEFIQESVLVFARGLTP